MKLVLQNGLILPTISIHTCYGLALVPSMFFLLKILSISHSVFVDHHFFVWNFGMNIKWHYTVTFTPWQRLHVMSSVEITGFTFCFSSLFYSKWSVNKWIVIWGAVSVKMYVTYWWRETVGHWAGNGRDKISKCVTLCVRVQSYCLLCLYWCQTELTDISLVYW